MLRNSKFFLVLLVFASIQASLQAVEVREPGNYPAVARVMAWTVNGGSLGSATCVYSSDMTGNSYLLTATHVIEGSVHRPRVTFPDGKSYFAEILYTSPGSDVTVLRISGKREHVRTITTEVPRVGDLVMFAGYGATSTHNDNRDHFLAYTGPVIGKYVSPYNRIQNRVSCWTPRISQGDSGGAVFYRGKLIGVISARIVQLQQGIYCETRTIGIDMSWIRKVDLQGITSSPKADEILKPKHDGRVEIKKTSRRYRGRSPRYGRWKAGR